MAMTLIEAAKLHSGNVVRSAIIEIFARTNMLLQAIMFDNIAGNSLSYNIEETLPGVGFRGINEAYAEDVGVLNPVTEKLFICGGDLDVDKFIVKTMGSDQRSVREGMKIKALALAFCRTFIKGDTVSNPKEFDGLQVRVTGGQIVDAGASDGGDALSLLKLQETIDKVTNPTHIIMNKTMRRLISAAAADPAVAGYVTRGVDAFGKQVTKFNDLPIIELDEDNLGNQILPFTEADLGAGADVCTSIYVVSFAEEALTGIQNGDIDATDLGEIDEKPVFRTRVEWYPGLACWNGKSAARLRGIKNAAVVK